MMTVKIGVKLFNIPANPDETSVSAYVNKNAGIKLAVIPMMKNNKNFFRFLIFLNAMMVNGNNAVEAIAIRSAATWVCVKIGVPSKAVIPLFIRMNELPQMKDNKTSNDQLNKFLDIKSLE